MRGLAWAFLRRDFLIWVSYRLSLVWQVGWMLVVIAGIYLLGRAVGGDLRLAEKYGGDYVAFLLSGLALTDLLSQALSAPARALRENQQTGTLEPMLLAPLRLFDFVIASCLFTWLFGLGRAAFYLLFGVLALGFWRQADPLAFLVVLIPGFLAFLGLGILAAAFVVLVKQGEAVIGAFTVMMALLGGMLFPVELLPGWLAPLSVLVPLTYALEGLRLALQGGSPGDVAFRAWALSLMAAGLLPLAILAFNWAINRAKQEGSLAQY